PLKITFPSTVVPSPIRLSMRVCGLLVLPPNIRTLLGKIDGPRRFGRLDAALQHAHLHPPDPSLGPAAEHPMPPLAKLQAQPVRGALLAVSWKDQHLRISTLLEIHDKLQLTDDLAAARACLHHEQLIAILAGQRVGADAKAVDADPRGRLAARRHERL